MQATIFLWRCLCDYVSCVIKDDGSVTERNGNRVFVLKVLDGENYAFAGDVFDVLHATGVVDADHTHLLLVENYFVDLGKVINLLDKAVVGSFVFDIRLYVAHINICVSATT